MQSNNTRKSIRQLIILLCAIVLLVGALYVGSWLTNRNRILEKSGEYSRLYGDGGVSVTIAPTQETLSSVVDQPLPTPDSNTLVIALPTRPPVQSSFSDLLSLNPDTIGFLRIDALLSLPVVQRPNDNDFYLNHSFEQAETAEGTLFLDGYNLLVPEDDCLIIYGHNMNNGTMFGELDHYDEADFLKAHPLVNFDTIFENRTYVPIAAFPASMNPDSGSYFEVRQMVFDEAGFDLFLSRLKSRSVLDIPVDAYYGDRMLLLVTCDYTKDDGRFIVALRELRAGETPEEAAAQIQKTK